MAMGRLPRSVQALWERFARLPNCTSCAIRHAAIAQVHCGLSPSFSFCSRHETETHSLADPATRQPLPSLTGQTLPSCRNKRGSCSREDEGTIRMNALPVPIVTAHEQVVQLLLLTLCLFHFVGTLATRIEVTQHLTIAMRIMINPYLFIVFLLERFKMLQ